jgi:hypothetical protein
MASPFTEKELVMLVDQAIEIEKAHCVANQTLIDAMTNILEHNQRRVQYFRSIKRLIENGKIERAAQLYKEMPKPLPVFDRQGFFDDPSL